MADYNKWHKHGCNGVEKMAIDGRLEKYQEDEFPNLATTRYRLLGWGEERAIALLSRVRAKAFGKIKLYFK